MRYATLLLALFIVGCADSKIEQTNDNEYEKFDSIIAKSEQNLQIASGANKKSDSLVTGKIEKTAHKIQKLETEVKQLKKENNELKAILYDIDNDRGQPYIIRTISDYQDY